MSDEKRGETFVLKSENPIQFSTFLIGLASSALIHLGGKNLVLARQTLDLLSMLQDKTRGNLTDEELQLFNHLLTDLRLRFVSASKETAT